jgi:hypothetical protein
VHLLDIDDEIELELLLDHELRVIILREEFPDGIFDNFH